MKERPILFSGPMVRAIIDGRKTQTRRIVKPQPAPVSFGWELKGARGASTQWGEHIKNPRCATLFCPHGQPGDRLWVRETWYCDHYLVQKGPYLCHSGAPEMLVFHADHSHPYEAEQPLWRPSIHMPRWASRITLAITRVRVERLNDISDGDARAEGVTMRGGQGYDGWAKQEYISLWESINGPGSWAANPWVWVIEFKADRLREGAT